MGCGMRIWGGRCGGLERGGWSGFGELRSFLCGYLGREREIRGVVGKKWVRIMLICGCV